MADATAASSASSASLGAFLAAQRWSGARGEVPGDVRVEATVPLDFAPCAIAVVGARVAGRDVRYQLVLPDATGVDALGARDGTDDARFRLGLARAIAGGGRWAGAGATLEAHAEHGAADVLAAVRTSRLGSAEQSNTSIVYDDGAIVKLFRRLEPGVHPDVEVTRFLTRRGFAHVPALLGTLTIADARGASVAAMAQRLVAGAADAWSHAVDSARAYVAGAAGVGYEAAAARLGVVTRAMHDALAADADDPDFAPWPADARAVERWASGARRSVRDGVRLLAERAGEGGELDAHDCEAAGAVLADGTATVDAAIAAIVERVGDDAGLEIRHHGDYHLGQVLLAPDGTPFVIDFEGEPSRPLDERRARHAALRDVAGMLRSFAYAAATARRERPEDAAVRERADAWERGARTALLDRYFSDAVAAYLPSNRARAEALLRLFELEKAFYELQYELRNRPDWVGIPLDGIRRLTRADRGIGA